MAARIRSYDELIEDAVSASISGWNFDFLRDRVREAHLPWSYERLACSAITPASRVVDLNTGGGEVFGDLLAERTPRLAVATETWPLNVSVAREHLGQFGVEVRHHPDGQPIPAADQEFDLVLNRHGADRVEELRRVLEPGGFYLMQRVGRDNDLELNVSLGGPAPSYRETATLEHDVAALQHDGFDILDSAEAHVEYGFCDIGAVVFHLRAVSWQVPGFNLSDYDHALRRLDAHIRSTGELVVRHHRYFVRARRP